MPDMSSSGHDPGPGDSLPLVTVVIPTLNSGQTLKACLESVRRQDYPADRLEIIIADAGSTDDTREIARELGVDRIVENELKTGEAGKTEGIKASRGEIIALIDSDNILEDESWLRAMVEPFNDPEIVASEPLEYTRRDQDPALTRYFAMLGMNDPVCLFLGNYDRYSMITGEWTGLDVEREDAGGYLKLVLDEDRLPTIGANGFVFRRSLLDAVTWEPYFFDIDVAHQAIAAGLNRMAKVKCGIVHLYCAALPDFARKQDRRIKDFLFFSQQRQRTYPWNRQKRRGIIRFCVYTILVLPLLVQTIRGCLRKSDPAWLYHVPVCWITLWIYGKAAMAKTFGITPGPKSREHWQR